MGGVKAMSTKIFNGYKLPLMTLQELSGWANKYRKVCNALATDKQQRQQLDMAIRLFDRHALGLLNKDTIEGYHWEGMSPWNLVVMIALEQDRKRNPQNDSHCELQLIPCADKILVLLYCNDPDFTTAFEKIPLITPYPYWDNTDPPDNVTPAEWQQRGKEWQRAIPSSIPARHGFGVQGTNTNIGLLKLADLPREMFPTRQQRITTLAQELALEREFTARTGKLKPGEYMSTLLATRQWLASTEKGKQLLTEITQEVRSKLPRIPLALALKQPLRKLKECHKTKAPLKTQTSRE